MLDAQGKPKIISLKSYVLLCISIRLDKEIKIAVYNNIYITMQSTRPIKIQVPVQT